jgi:hypothetical protein
MHCEWRLHRQFIMWAAGIVGNNQVVDDPTVSVFNCHRFFYLNVLTRACAEYVNFIAQTPGAPSLDDPNGWLAQAEANIDFAWVCHFLHDAGFFVLDFLQAVRSNESHKLDLLWREFFPSAHSGTANKTQYVPMSIMRVFWGMALVPELSDLYHKIRTIPNNDENGSGVGWDMAIEMLNAAIKAHVCHRVSEAQISKFVEQWALLECVQSRMRNFMYSGRAAGRGRHTVDATLDVNQLVAEFKNVVGSTWAHATRANLNCHVTKGAARQVRPWAEVARVMARTGEDEPATYVRKQVSQLTGFFAWLP